jgi:hypothetical protein
MLDKISAVPCEVPYNIFEAAARALLYCSLAREVILSAAGCVLVAPMIASLTALVTSEYISPAWLMILCVFSEYAESSSSSIRSSNMGIRASTFCAIAPPQTFCDAVLAAEEALLLASLDNEDALSLATLATEAPLLVTALMMLDALSDKGVEDEGMAAEIADEAELTLFDILLATDSYAGVEVPMIASLAAVAASSALTLATDRILSAIGC